MEHKVLLWSGIAGVAFILIIVGGLFWGQGACRDFDQGRVTIDGVAISVAVAEAQVDRTRGLSGCERIPERSGMYFPYDSKQIPRYWMKGMLVPLDFVWIADGRVIGVTENVPAPTTELDEELPYYKPPAGVDGVLEIGGGQVRELGIAVGDTVTVSR